jgi:hypothetical protein
MTDELMKGLAAQAFNMARRDMQRGEFNFLLAVYYEGEGLHRMTKVERVIIEILGEDWLNHGRAKDAGFGVMREAVGRSEVEAIVFGCVINNFTPTEKFRSLAPAAQDAILNDNHDRHWQEVKTGNFKVCDALLTTVQTPTRLCICKRNLEGSGEQRFDFLDQAEFRGRMKLFGDDSCGE